MVPLASRGDKVFSKEANGSDIPHDSERQEKISKRVVAHRVPWINLMNMV